MQPWLLLDIDGVLNAGSELHTVEYDLVIPADEMPEHPFVVQPEGDLTFHIRLRPEHPAWLAQLAESYELAWASTWEHLANAYLAPLLGLEPLPYVEHSAVKPTFSEARSYDVASWKWRTIETFAQGRAAAWVDDSAWQFADRDDLRAEPTLVLAPSHVEGMTEAHLETLERFAADLSAAATGR